MFIFLVVRHLYPRLQSLEMEHECLHGLPINESKKASDVS